MSDVVGTTSCRVLVVDDHERVRDSMVETLRCAGHQVEEAANGLAALRLVERETFDVIVTDLNMPGMTGLELIRRLSIELPGTQVVMVTAFASVATAVEAMRYGAFDYIEKPFSAEQLEDLVSRAFRQSESGAQRSSVPDPQAVDAMVGSSPVMQELRRKIEQVAPTSETVLVIGESGVGKELVAQAIHQASGRGAHPLVSVNCPALSPQLMESELFGHERGSFTSADAPRVGRFELADQGTLFLDEVTEISLELQAKLLRVLQENAYERVGSSQTSTTNARVIASSNRDLPEEIRAGKLREDLYFRLAVVPLQVPTLRARREDLQELVAHFFQRTTQRLGRPTCRFAHETLEMLQEYAWPGNVRELENLITRASVLFQAEEVGPDEIRPWLLEGTPDGVDLPDARFPIGMNLQEMEQRLIEVTLERYDGHRARTAEALGIGVRTLTNKLRAYGYAPRAKVAV